MNKRFVYADNAATTTVSKPVLDEMIPYFTEEYGNASSIYSMGRSAKKALETARERIAKTIGADASEIYFTSCGSESDNWAIRSVAERLALTGKKHIITSIFEHHAVLHTCQALEKNGFEVTYLPVYENGIVKAEDLKNAIRNDTALVTIMYANNEIGTIQPVDELAAICHDKGVIFHTDAVQAVGHVEINVHSQKIDMMSVSGHKIHAPKGVGLLYVKKGIPLTNFIYGGAQERNRRGGTENLPSIIGLAKAMEIANTNIKERAEKTAKQRDKLINEILKISHTRLNGDPAKRLPGTVNISIEGIEGESLLLMLDLKGICASSGSACTSGSLDPSHVLLALGLKHEVAHGSLRLSINDETTDEDIDYIIEAVPEVVTRLRDMSPLWEKIIKEEKA